MRIRHLFFALPFGLMACNSGDSAIDDPATAQAAVTSSFGGATETDEIPAFGDSVLDSPEYTTDDATVTDPTADANPDLATAPRLYIAVGWGLFPPQKDATQVVQWDPTITAQNAGIRVVSPLRFEDNDAIVRPRTSISEVSITSSTRPGADGVLLSVIMAPRLNPTNGPVTLTFTSAVYTHTLTLEQGMRLTGHDVVDDAGHQVVYRVFRPDHDACKEGLMGGQWKTLAEPKGMALGVLRGRIMHAGHVTALFRGVFGQRPDGKNVLFAKAIDGDGKFVAILVGRYGDDGKFGGLILGKDKVSIGRFVGLYFDRNGDGEGRFLGRWSMGCKERQDEGTTPASDEPDVSTDDSGSNG
jgi:hypothetical protein